MKKYPVDEEIVRLTNFIREKGGDATPIAEAKIVTGEWVRMKCLFGCNGFGRRFSCPPYTPTPAETQVMLDGYSHALLVRFDGDVGETTPERLVSREMTRYVQTEMFALEEMAFHDGFYKAFGYTGHQCGWCGKSTAKEEGAVITDCKTAGRCGRVWKLRVLMCMQPVLRRDGSWMCWNVRKSRAGRF